LKELGINWQRARRWIRSPDEHYEAKKAARLAESAGEQARGLDAGR
jgi:hypothetical protein